MEKIHDPAMFWVKDTSFQPSVNTNQNRKTKSEVLQKGEILEQ